MKFGRIVTFKIRYLKICIDLWIIPLIIIIIVNNIFTQYLMTFICIFAHEFGHISVALLSGAKLYGLRILPIGLNALIYDMQCSRISRILIYITGPCINLILALLNFYIIKLDLVSIINLSLAIFNLLPILPLDGGKIAVEILSARYGLFKASKFLHVVSVIISLTIIAIGILIFRQARYNISFLLIGAYIFLCIKESKREIAFMNIKNIIFRRARIIKKGIYPAREIVVMKNIRLSEIIKAMDFTDMFHLVNILDDNLRVIKIMTEQEILDASIKNGTDITFDKLLSITIK